MYNIRVPDLKNLPGWKYNSRQKFIYADYTLTGFTSAVHTINKIAKLADKADHHPDIHLTNYKKLRIVLTSHDVGRVTGRDIRLAGQIQKILSIT